MANPNRLNAGTDYLERTAKFTRDLAFIALSLPLMHVQFHPPSFIGRGVNTGIERAVPTSDDLPKGAQVITEFKHGQLTHPFLVRTPGEDWVASVHTDLPEEVMGFTGGVPEKAVIIKGSADLSLADAIDLGVRSGLFTR